MTVSNNAEQDDDVVRVSPEAWEAFNLALDRPPARVSGLVELLDRKSVFEPLPDERD